MSQKGLNKDIILSKAIELIERKGSPSISMREIADELSVKTPSLYNHIKSMNELFVDISYYAAKQLKLTQLNAIKGKNQDEALFALAIAYRNFAKKHIGLYKVTISVTYLQEDILKQITSMIAEPIFLILSKYELNEEQSIHWQRILRSIIHGFITQEEAGFFQHSPINVDMSFDIALHCFLNGLKNEIKEN